MTFIDKGTNELAYKIIGCAYNVHRALGPGLLENTCEACLCYELNRLNIKYERQKELPVLYENTRIDCGYRIDILVENKIIIELKNGKTIPPYPHSPDHNLYETEQNPFRTVD